VVTGRIDNMFISGGENISSIEVEKALYSHPAVSLCAVVAMPDEKWGEVPCAFVELSGDATESDLLVHAKARLAGYQRPKKVIFGELPKTTTGKIRKNELRDLVRSKS
jgi:fatty-acyl-CoA synthase